MVPAPLRVKPTGPASPQTSRGSAHQYWHCASVAEQQSSYFIYLFRGYQYGIEMVTGLRVGTRVVVLATKAKSEGWWHVARNMEGGACCGDGYPQCWEEVACGWTRRLALGSVSSVAGRWRQQSRGRHRRRRRRRYM